MRNLKMPNKKAMIIFAGVAAGAVLIWAAFHFTKTPVFSQTRLYEVKKGFIESEISESVTLESVTNTQLAFENAGKIKDVYVSVGDEVKEGQLLAEEISSDYMAALNGAVASRDAAVAQLEQAKEDVKIQSNKTKSLRQSDANKYDIKAQKDAKDKSKAGVDAAEAFLEAAQSAVNEASLQLKKTKLLAPADGTIASRDIEAGEVVAQAVPAMTLSSTGDLQASAQVSELDVKKISVGDNAQIEISSVGQNKIYIEAEVKNIYPSGAMEDSGNAYKVEFGLAEQNSDLKPGMTGTAGINLSQKTGMVIIPQSSLFSTNGESYVMVLSGGLPEKKRVQVGAQGADSMVEIISGLSEGDKIIQF